jgi:hypothetical protein
MARLGVIRARGHKAGGGVPFGFCLGVDGRTLVPVWAQKRFGPDSSGN